MSARTRRTGPGGGGSFAEDRHDDQIALNRTNGGMTAVADDPLAKVRFLFDALGPSVSVGLVAELARLVVTVEPTTLVPTLPFLVTGLLS